MSENKIRRNVMRSMVISPANKLVAATMGLILVGLFVRVGGLTLVGQWALMQSVIGLTACIDLGLGVGLTRRAAEEGPESTYPSLGLVTLMLTPVIAVAVAVGVFLLDSAMIGSDMLASSAAGVAFAAAGGGVQLLAQWWTSPQRGAHRHHLFVIGEFTRNTTQFALACLLLLAWSDGAPSLTSLGLVVFAPRLLELAVALVGLRFSPVGFTAWLAAPRLGTLAKVRECAEPYAMFSVTSKLRDPMLQFLIGALAGEAALGAYAIAWRIPVLIMNVASAGFMSLMPGFAGLAHDRAAMARLAAAGLTAQVALCAPLLAFYLFNAPPALELWLGRSDQAVVAMTHAFTLSTMTNSAVTPFYWALQAMGQARWQAGVLAMESTVLALLVTAIIWLSPPGIGVEKAAFVVAVAAASVQAAFLVRAQAKLGLATAAWRLSPHAGILGALALYGAIAWLVSAISLPEIGALMELALRAVAFVVPASMATLLLLHRMASGTVFTRRR